MAMAATFTATFTTIASAIATAATASAFTAEHIQGALDFFVGSRT
jgi:hypothetical protein